MPKASARFANSLPMRPMPRMASVLPLSSTPSNFLRSHFPAITLACACGMWRASETMRVKACSAVEMVLPPGVFMTTTPWVGGRGDVDIVDADAGAADRLQVGRSVKDWSGDLGLRANDDSVVLISRGQQVSLLDADLHDHIELRIGFEFVDSDLRDRIRDKDLRFRHPFP